MITLECIEADDSSYCGVCSTHYDNVAKIRINSGLIICLCEKCLNQFLESVKEFNDTIFCNKCKYFKENKSGKTYSGKCSLFNRDSNYMDMCSKAEPYDL